MQPGSFTTVCTLVMTCGLTGCTKTDATPPPGSDKGDVAPSGSNSALELDLAQPNLKAPTLAPTPVPTPVGERGIARDYFMTLISVKECQVEPHFRPKAEHLKLGLDVLLEGRTEREVPTNPFSATLTDAQDRDYQVDLAGCTPTLRADRITRDRQARGFITFEVPGNATGLKLKYAPFVVGVGPEELQFSLGR